MSADGLPAAGAAADRRSPFAGAGVCDAAGFRLRPGLRGPVFDDDIWDFAGVVGLPVHLHPWQRRLNFTAIAAPRWVVVAKELLLALLAPRHPAVTVLPWAYRTPLHLNTCHARLQELTRWLNWLTAQGVASLQEVTDEHCEAYLAHRRHARDEHGRLLGDRSPATRRAAVLAILELNNYRELFTTDRYPAGLRPWGGASASSVAEFTKSGENKTPPVPQRVLQPMLAAALYLTGTRRRRHPVPPPVDPRAARPAAHHPGQGRPPSTLGPCRQAGAPSRRQRPGAVDAAAARRGGPCPGRGGAHRLHHGHRRGLRDACV